MRNSGLDLSLDASLVHQNLCVCTVSMCVWVCVYVCVHLYYLCVCPFISKKEYGAENHKGPSDLNILPVTILFSFNKMV